MFKTQRFGILLLFLCLVLGLTACSNQKKSTVVANHNTLPHGVPTNNPAAGLFNPPPDYTHFTHWAAHPLKQDPSDSTPLPFRNFTPDTTVDVFFLHPTSYTGSDYVNESALSLPEERLRWNAFLDNENINQKTDRGSIYFQASAFNKYRLFAPRYRQAHIRAFYLADSLSKPFFEMAYADIKAAFQYYLTHYNQGRPFIIAAHSQGTVHAARLIKEEIETNGLKEKMVAAYLIGMPVPANYFAHCAPCSSSNQTGCIISWRTYKKGYIPEVVQKENYKTIVTNPLSWTNDEVFVSKQQNKGSLFFDFNQPKLNTVSAQVKGNILWANKPRFKGSLFFTRKNYHIGDINLYWKNIRDNLQERVMAHRLQHTQ